MSKIRLGVLGGGGDSLIGVLHRVASNMYDRYEITGGFLIPSMKRTSNLLSKLVSIQIVSISTLTRLLQRK